jgi:hypothetical protein
MSAIAEKYGIPKCLDVFIDRGFVVLSHEDFAEKTVYFHVPSRSTVDQQDRETSYSVMWIHPDFNEQFFQTYFEKPGDAPNFEVVVDTEHVGPEYLDIQTIDELVCWLVDLSNSGYRDGTMREGIAPEKLADEFCRILNEWLTPEEFAEINRRNATAKYQGLCATHDFCDPNQAMCDAEAVLGIELDCRFNEDIALMDAAWDIAKKRGFAIVKSRTGECLGA